MTQQILEKLADCTSNVSVIENITNPTQFILTTHGSGNATIRFNNTLVATLNSTNPVFKAYVAGDYTVSMTGRCSKAVVCIDDILDEGAASNQVDSEILIDCGAGTETVPVNQVVSIAGTERPLNVRVIEDCVQQDYEIVCASTDGRILLLQTIANPPTLTEIDGSAIGDGATAVKCDVEYAITESCWQDITDNSIRYVRVIIFDVNDPANISVVWLNAAGTVIAEPANIEPCSSDTGTLDDQTHVLTHGVNTSVPSGAKSAVIANLTGTTTIDGVFQLGASPLPTAITYGANTPDEVRALLPAITIAGGTWQWSAILPVAEI